MYISPLVTKRFHWDGYRRCLVLNKCFQVHASFTWKQGGHMLTTKNVYFVKLSKCEMDFTIAFLSSRRSKNIYGMSNLKSEWRSYALGKMPCCREFRPKSGLPVSLKKSAWVSGVIPTSGVPTKVGSSNCREFRPKSGLPTYLKKIMFGSGLLNSDPNCSKLMENLENKGSRGFLLG